MKRCITFFLFTVLSVGRKKRASFDCVSKWQELMAQDVQDFSASLSNTTVHQGVMDIVLRELLSELFDLQNYINVHRHHQK